MSKAEEYLDNYYHWTEGIGKEEIVELMQDFFDQQFKERIEAITDDEIKLIFKEELTKSKGTSWAVELEYHEHTFISGAESLLKKLLKSIEHE